MTAPQKESVSRWLPTIVAVLAILGQVFWFGQRTGTIEANVKVLSDNQTVLAVQIREMVPRSEYSASQAYAVREMGEVKQAILRTEDKVDELILRTR